MTKGGPLISNRAELEKFLIENPGVPHDREDLISNCVPHGPVPMMLEDLKSTYVNFVPTKE